MKVMVIRRRGWTWHLTTGTGAWVGRYWVAGRWIVFARRDRTGPP